LIPLSAPLVHPYTHRSPGRQLGGEGTAGIATPAAGTDDAGGTPGTAQPVRLTIVSAASQGTIAIR
jgi:hypothetical protein